MDSFNVEFVKSARKEFDRLPAKKKTTTAEALKLLCKILFLNCFKNQRK